MDSGYAASYSRTLQVTPPRRNPITQVEVSTPKFKRSKKSPPRPEASPTKTEGIARATYSDKGWRSFSLSYSTPEPYSPMKRIISPAPSEPIRGSTLYRKSEYTPVRRNPIIQEECEITPPKIRPKITEGSLIFSKSKGKTVQIEKNRPGLYFENMKSRVFSGPEVEVKLCLKKVPTRASEVASLITYKDCILKEELQSKKPNSNQIKRQDLVQKGTLTGLAKVYSERVIKSQVVFN